jgi:hypothetical protein
MFLSGFLGTLSSGQQLRPGQIQQKDSIPARFPEEQAKRKCDVGRRQS